MFTLGIAPPTSELQPYCESYRACIDVVFLVERAPRGTIVAILHTQPFEGERHINSNTTAQGTTKAKGRLQETALGIG